MSKDYHDSDTIIDQELVLSDLKTNITGLNDEDEDQSMQFINAKRIKSRGRLDKIVDFNKFFIIFLAIVNTGYFLFLYLLNSFNYQEYNSLSKLSVYNNGMALSVTQSFNKVQATIYDPFVDNSILMSDFEPIYDEYLSLRSSSLQVNLNNSSNY